MDQNGQSLLHLAVLDDQMDCIALLSKDRNLQVRRNRFRAKREGAIERDRIWMGVYYDKEIEEGIPSKVFVRWIDAKIGYTAFTQKRGSYPAPLSANIPVLFNRENSIMLVFRAAAFAIRLGK